MFANALIPQVHIEENTVSFVKVWLDQHCCIAYNHQEVQ